MHVLPSGFFHFPPQKIDHQQWPGVRVPAALHQGGQRLGLLGAGPQHQRASRPLFAIAARLRGLVASCQKGSKNFTQDLTDQFLDPIVPE